MTTTSTPVHTNPAKKSASIEFSWIAVVAAILFEVALAFISIQKDINLDLAYKQKQYVTPLLQAYTHNVETLTQIVGMITLISLIGVVLLSRLAKWNGAPAFWAIIIGVLDAYQLSACNVLQDTRLTDRLTNKLLLESIRSLQISSILVIAALVLFVLWHAWAPRKNTVK
jgi:hypothetical protein